MTAVQLVPVEKIRVINARSRNKTKFREIIENISTVDLKKPITVSRREGDDDFDLVCGQGRLEAFVACGASEIPAIVVDIPLEDRLLRSLVENLTRRTPSRVELARYLVRLNERGHSHADIATLIGVSEPYVSQLVRLVENGEKRLVAAQERGDILITAAIEIAASDGAAIQRSLQEAYDSGKLRGRAAEGEAAHRGAPRPWQRTPRVGLQTREIVIDPRPGSHAAPGNAEAGTTGEEVPCLRAAAAIHPLSAEGPHEERALRNPSPRGEAGCDAQVLERDDPEMTATPIKAVFDFEGITVRLDKLLPTRTAGEKLKQSAKCRALLASVREVGSVEPLSV